jgi:phospholipid/cholesterol/gamma-HCH transport system permease protein
MGVNSSGYLILPKVVGGLIVIPMLIVISMFLSILGGYVAGSLSGALAPQEYLSGLLKDWNPVIIDVSIIKTVVFTFIMTTVSSYQGFYTSGGALEVGRASTKAVVYSCILILFADYLVAQIIL